MRKNEVAQCIHNIFLDCCRNLFQSLDCNVNLIEGDDINLNESPIACIDAGSDDIEFAIGLQLPLQVLALTYPVAEGIITVEENRLEDWISELSNQLIGRLKAKLIEHDCFVNIGLPQSYFGAQVDDLLSDNSNQEDYYFDIDGEVCRCSISIEVFDEAISFSIEKNESIDMQEEGELELF
tara:strand:+ start:18314 stop:18856 length:543 start_codon:yes stop_codon:yes gene_type:complete